MKTNGENSLILMTKASQLLAKANTIQKVKEFKNMALLAADYAKRKRLGKEAVQHAQSYAFMAERKLGEMLRETERHPPGPDKQDRLPEGTDLPPTLAELGITKKESFEAQLLAEVEEKKFEKIIEGKKSKKAVLNEKRRERKREELKAKNLIPGEKKYRIIYADPPWKYDQWLPHQYGDVEKHYPPMSIEELCAMPIKEMTEKNAVLFLWVTSPKLEQSFKVLKAWEFEYKTSFVWDKIKHNFGHYNSVRHEFLLIGGKGSSTPDSRKLFGSVVSIERSEKHSEKPSFFRDMIDELYTWGNRLELFHRGEKKDNWDVWGNDEDERRIF